MTAEPQTGRFTGQLAMLFCAILWSTSGLFIKLLDWNPMLIAGMRGLVATLALLPARRILAGGKPFPWKSAAFWLGGIANCLTMTLFVIANKLTAGANVILLQYSAPIWAALLGWLILGERPNLRHWIGLALVIGGLYIIFRNDLTGGNILGDILAVVSGLTFGLVSVFLRMQKNASPLDSLLLSHALTALAAVPFAFIYPMTFAPLALFSWLFMGIFQSASSSVLFAIGIKRVRAVEAMLLSGIEPILNPVWVFLVTAEKPSPQTLLGGAIILGAVFFASRPERPAK
jgi:drug/metabolite transporter (DMT)-like permease